MKIGKYGGRLVEFNYYGEDGERYYKLEEVFEVGIAILNSNYRKVFIYHYDDLKKGDIYFKRAVYVWLKSLIDDNLIDNYFEVGYYFIGEEYSDFITGYILRELIHDVCEMVRHDYNFIV